MQLFSYDKTSRDSILQYANNLEGLSFAQFCKNNNIDLDEDVKDFGKGTFGNFIEKHFFGIENNNRKEADFPEAETELKTTALKVLKNKSLSVKERLVLSKINYNSIVKEDWDDNTLFKKIKYILIMFYFYEKDAELKNLIFNFVNLWQPSKSDMATIKKDWNLIVNKVKDGKAHELSEGDTFYLGACTKGALGSDESIQPNSDIPAQPRAFSFKRSYMQYVFTNLSASREIKEMCEKESFDDVVLNSLKSFYGKSISDFMKVNSLTRKRKAKHFLSLVFNDFSKKTFGCDWKKIEEFQKSGIEVKTTVLQPDGIPNEDMSFEQIDYLDISLQNWDDSDIKEKFENKKHLWIVMQSVRNFEKQKELSLDEIKIKKVFFWNMPVSDLYSHYKDLWVDTVDKIRSGDYHNFIKSVENKVGFIRRKARKGETKTTNTPDGSSQKINAFWLNRYYVAEQIKKAE